MLLLLFIITNMIENSQHSNEKYQVSYQKYIDKLTHLRTTHNTVRRLPAVTHLKSTTNRYADPIRHKHSSTLLLSSNKDNPLKFSEITQVTCSQNTMRYKT